MTFRVGMRVECVYAGPSRLNPELGSPPLVKYVVYTVSDVYINQYDTGLAIELLEVKSEGVDWMGFDATRFRPVVERKTDISAFHEILRKTSHKETVRA